MGDEPMKVAYEKTLFGNTYSVVATTTSGDQGQRVVELVKPGNPFWAWPSLPSGYGMISAINFGWGENFSWGAGAPICPQTAAEANAILAELAEIGPSVEQVLTPRQA